MKDIDLSDEMDALEAFTGQLMDLTDDIDRSYRPVVVRLTALEVPGSDVMCEKLEAAVSAIEALAKITGGVQFAGGDEGGFLYWEFELSEDRTEEQATAAMHNAFGGLEFERVLPLYREFRARISTVEEIMRPPVPKDAES